MKKLLTIALMAASLSACDKKQIFTTDTFVVALRDHYKSAQNFDKFSVKYSTAFENAYQAYDYRIPRAGVTEATAEIDTINGTYF